MFYCLLPIKGIICTTFLVIGKHWKTVPESCNFDWFRYYSLLPSSQDLKHFPPVSLNSVILIHACTFECELPTDLLRIQVGLLPLPSKDIINIATKYSFSVNNPCICVQISLVQLVLLIIFYSNWSEYSSQIEILQVVIYKVIKLLEFRDICSL